MANELTVITDELISLIQTNYSRFTDTDRIQLAQEVEFENLGYEDTIILNPLPIDSSVILTSGKIVTYPIELIYYKKVYTDKLETISDFAESLDSYLLGYKHHVNYWVLLDIIIDYDIEIPEAYEGKLNGFIMTITFSKYKAE